MYYTFGLEIVTNKLRKRTNTTPCRYCELVRLLSLLEVGHWQERGHQLQHRIIKT